MSELQPDLDCASVRAEFSAALDGELEPRRQAVVEQHLAECEACRADDALLRLVSQATGQVPRLEPPGDMRVRLLKRVAAEPAPCPVQPTAERMEIMIIERPGEKVVYQRTVDATSARAQLPRQAAISRPSSSMRVLCHERRTGSHTVSCEAVSVT